MQKVSIRQALINFRDDTAQGHTNDTPVLLEWAKRAEFRINSKPALSRSIGVFDVKNCRVTLPASALGVLLVFDGDKGCDCNQLFTQALSYYGQYGITNIGTNLFFYFQPQGSETLNILLNYEWQQDSIVFYGTIPKQVTVWYVHLPTDEEGFPLVSANHIEAITAFLEYMKAKQTTWGKKGFSFSEVNFLKNEWHRLCADAGARDLEPSMADREIIRRLTNDMLIGTYKGINLFNSTDF